MIDFFALILTSVFVNNFVLSKFLGLCPFVGTSKSDQSCLGMSLAVIFVLTFTSFFTYIINAFILKPNDLEYLQTLVFILSIASLVQIIEMLLKKHFIVLYQILGIFLPLITTNCAVLGVALINTNNNNGLFHSVLYGFSAGIGFSVALFLLTNLREVIEEPALPKAFKGNAIIFITIGLLAIGFSGFSGIGGY